MPQNHTSRWLKPEASLYINIHFQSQEEILLRIYKPIYWVCDWQKLKWRKLLYIQVRVVKYHGISLPSTLHFISLGNQTEQGRVFPERNGGVLLELIKFTQCLLWMTGMLYSKVLLRPTLFSSNQALGAAGHLGTALKDLSSKGLVGVSQGWKKESGTIPLVLLLVPSPFSCLSQRGCLVRREIYCQIQGQWCSEGEEQLMVKCEMKKKKELYDLKKCSSANGIKCNSTKVKDHILRRKWNFCYNLGADQPKVTEWKKDVGIWISHRMSLSNQHYVAVGKD